MTALNGGSSSYDSGKFTNRQEEIRQVLSMVRQPQPRIRALVIEGDRGAGKTWLSLHLHRTVFTEEIGGLTSWLFSLWNPGENYRPWGEKLQQNEWFAQESQRLDIDEFLAYMMTSLSIEATADSVLVERVEAIRQYVQNHVDEHFVLILDSAYESDWKFLEQLETHFLGNLLTLENFFVIVTGRGRPYPWKIPYLIEAIRFGLGRFSIEQVQEQLQKFNLSSSLSAEDIFAIGEGWPLFTEHLARAAGHTEALELAVNILFTVIPLYERQSVRRYFEALSPLDGFGETEAALMVETYENSAPPDGRMICRKMNETRLISWKNGRYEMNAPVRKTLQQYLPLTNRDAWVRLQCAAYRHFDTQAKDRSMERFRKFFEGQVQTHAKALSEAGIDDAHLCSVQPTEETSS